MKIVICDDCMEDLVQVERLLQKYEKNANSKFEVETFSDASKVYHKVLQHELADIYILDMICQVTAKFQGQFTIFRNIYVIPLLTFQTGKKKELYLLLILIM